MVTMRDDRPDGRTVSGAGALVPRPPLLCAFRVPPSARAAGEARRRVLAAVRTWGLPLPEETVGDLGLCVGEVLANAVVHTGAESGVLVQWTGRRLRVEVRDGSPRLPRTVRAAREDEGGRGLLLVAALADRWGAGPDGTGKTVWFEFRCAFPVGA